MNPVFDVIPDLILYQGLAAMEFKPCIPAEAGI